MNNDEKILIKEIDKNLGGESLSLYFIKSFELEFNKFKDNFDFDAVESKKHLDEMVQLLSISEENLEKVKNQKWFQRVWFTVAGKNKKLERINKINLLKVQKGSLFFLQNLANQSPLLMQFVNFSLKRIDDIQIQNERIKSFLFTIVDRYNDRIVNIEDRLQEQAKEIIRSKNNNDIPHIGLLLSSILLISGSITILFVFERNWYIWIGSVLLFLFGIILLIGSFSRDDEINNEDRNPVINKIKDFNNNIKPDLKKNLSFVLTNILENNTLYFPIIPLIENWNKISDLLEPFSTEEGMKTEQVADIIFNSLQISPDQEQLIIVNCSKTAEEYINLINQVTSDIIKNYLPDSIGIDLKTQIGYTKREEINKKIESVIQPYFQNLFELESIRKELIIDFSKYKKILTRSGWIDFGKGFGKGFVLTALLGPIGFIGVLIWEIILGENAQEIVENFANKFNSYIIEWEKLLNTIEKSVYPFLQNITKLFITECVHNMDIIFDEFSNQYISLADLNNEIMELLQEQEKCREAN